MVWYMVYGMVWYGMNGIKIVNIINFFLRGNDHVTLRAIDRTVVWSLFRWGWGGEERVRGRKGKREGGRGTGVNEEWGRG